MRELEFKSYREEIEKLRARCAELEAALQEIEDNAGRYGYNAELVAQNALRGVGGE